MPHAPRTRLFAAALCLTGASFAAPFAQGQAEPPPAQAADTADADAHYQRFVETYRAASGTRSGEAWLANLTAACDFIQNHPGDPRVTEGAPAVLRSLEQSAQIAFAVQDMEPRAYCEAARARVQRLLDADLAEEHSAFAMQQEVYMTMRVLYAEAPEQPTPEQRAALLQRLFEEADRFHERFPDRPEYGAGMYIWCVGETNKDELALALATIEDRYPDAADTLAYGRALLRVANMAGQPFEVVFNDAVSGERVNLAEDYHGKVVVVDFWATWCAACIGKMPELAELAREHEQTLQVVGFSGDVDTENMAEFLEANPQYGWPQYYLGEADEHGQQVARTRWGITAWPTVILLDAQGRMRYRGEGMFGTLYSPAGEVAHPHISEKDAIDRLMAEREEAEADADSPAVQP